MSPDESRVSTPGVDPSNEKSTRAVAKAKGFRKIDDELYEPTAEAFAAGS